MSLDWKVVPGAIWRSHQQRLRPVNELDAMRVQDLLGVDAQRDALLQNTVRFARGEPSNNALLWGARGTGKSSLVKAVINAGVDHGVRVIQIDRDDLNVLPDIVEDHVRGLPWRFIIFCDDLSFNPGDYGYRALKSVLEGSIEPAPENVRVYATSNRRHLVTEYTSDNDNAQVVGTELHYGDEVEEKISLADRFGLTLSFHPISQDLYLAIVDHLFDAQPPAAHDQPADFADRAARHAEALRFAQAKGGRSGRTARQFFNAHGRNRAATPSPEKPTLR